MNIKDIRYTLMFRWSVASAAAIALFWTGWYFANGSVPVVSEIQITRDWVISLPFALSRWWDMLLGPIYTVVVVLFLSSKYFCDRREALETELVVGLGAGLVFGLVVALSGGLVVALSGGLVFGLVVALSGGLVVGLSSGLIAGLGAGLGFGLKHLFKWLCPIIPSGKGLSESTVDTPGDSESPHGLR